MKSSEPAEVCTIGEAAARYGLAASVLRHWDAAGVLRPTFRRGGQRRYSFADVYRIGVVLFCQQAGLSLTEIAQLLSTRRPKARRAMLRRKEAELAARVAAATAARRMVREVMSCSAPDPLACPRFRATVDANRPRRTSPLQTKRSPRDRQEAAGPSVGPGGLRQRSRVGAPCYLP